MAARGDKIEKIIARMHQRIREGQYYEAQQQTRVVAARHIKAANWPAAIDLLSGVAQALLRAGQGGSGGDLSVLLVDVYRQAALRPDAVSRGRLLACLRLFAPDEPTRKKFITEMMGWSAKLGDFPAGDPELHHVVGALLAAEQRDPYDAERHLLLGTRESPAVLARMEFAWYRQDDPHTAALYAARAVLPYLLLANVRGAHDSFRVFTDELRTASPSTAAVQDLAAATAEARVFPGLPLLNFLGLLLLAVQRGGADLFRQLTTRYAAALREPEAAGVDWAEALASVGEMYFGIQRPRQSNPLLDMMGSLFGGAGGGAAGGGGAGAAGRKPAGRTLDAPVAEGLD